MGGRIMSISKNRFGLSVVVSGNTRRDAQPKAIFLWKILEKKH